VWVRAIASAAVAAAIGLAAASAPSSARATDASAAHSRHHLDSPLVVAGFACEDDDGPGTDLGSDETGDHSLARAGAISVPERSAPVRGETEWLSLLCLK
jgi:hypothetical protein